MKNIILTIIIALFLVSPSIAKDEDRLPTPDQKKRHAAFMESTKHVRVREAKRKIANEKKSKAHYKWLNANKDKIYMLKKNIIVGMSRERVVKAINVIKQQGWTYNTKKIRRLRVTCLRGWSPGRIIEVVKGSNVVKVEFKMPYSKNIVERWIWGGHMELMTEYKKNMIK